ncbi:DUF4386 domain-containing protein [Pricia sp.]|uniref:DUF4386 domain-containing protein n=1 Tax=Pricia sp. TaxID=2268138 RepID=UPI0035943072
MITDKNLARIAGLCYLIVIATGLFSEVFVRQALRVANDAVATANNIQTHEMLYRWGFVADITNFVIGLPSALIMYFLFKRVNKLLVQLALAFAIIQTAIIAVNLLNQISPLLILGNDAYLNSFRPDQLASLSLLSLNIQAQGYGLGLVFFGFYCLIFGYAIIRSKMIPKILGALYAITGICYLLNSFIMFLSKGFDNPFFAYLAIPIFIGELSLCLWLLINGVDTSKRSTNR